MSVWEIALVLALAGAGLWSVGARADLYRVDRRGAAAADRRRDPRPARHRHPALAIAGRGAGRPPEDGQPGLRLLHDLPRLSSGPVRELARQLPPHHDPGGDPRDPVRPTRGRGGGRTGPGVPHRGARRPALGGRHQRLRPALSRAHRLELDRARSPLPGPRGHEHRLPPHADVLGARRDGPLPTGLLALVHPGGALGASRGRLPPAARQHRRPDDCVGAQLHRLPLHGRKAAHAAGGARRLAQARGYTGGRARHRLRSLPRTRRGARARAPEPGAPLRGAPLRPTGSDHHQPGAAQQRALLPGVRALPQRLPAPRLGRHAGHRAPPWRAARRLLRAPLLREHPGGASRPLLLGRRNLPGDRPRVHRHGPVALLHRGRAAVPVLPLHARQRSRPISWPGAWKATAPVSSATRTTRTASPSTRAIRRSRAARAA